MPDKVACPRCSRTQPVRPDASVYFCDDCRIQFDGIDDGDYCTDPTRRIERQEEQSKRKGRGPGTFSKFQRHVRRGNGS